jgi:hypothetical protein
MTIHVEELSSRDDEIIDFLDRLGRTTPSVLGYHYPFYRDMLVEIGVGRSVYLGARLSGELVGLLPGFARESGAGVVYSSLPYFGPNAGVLCSNDEARIEIHAALLQALLTRAEQDKALSCSIYTPFLFDEFELYDAAVPEAILVEKFTQYLDLRITTWNKGAIARNLQKAKRVGLEISEDVTPERMESFYAIYERNCKDYGIPLKPRGCVEFLVTEGVRGKHTSIYFAFYEGEMVGGLLMIWSPLTASYYIPCSLAGARTLQPGPALIEQAIHDARARGIQIWNWESSPSRVSGVYRFKEKWGSVEGSYRIYVQTFCPRERFQELGKDAISKHFPFYFVYPFDRLMSSVSQ